MFFETNKEKVLKQQQVKFMHFKELVRIYDDIENRIKALKEKGVNFHSTMWFYVWKANCRRNLHYFSCTYSKLNF